MIIMIISIFSVFLLTVTIAVFFLAYKRKDKAIENIVKRYEAIVDAYKYEVYKSTLYAQTMETEIIVLKKILKTTSETFVEKELRSVIDDFMYKLDRSIQAKKYFIKKDLEKWKEA